VIDLIENGKVTGFIAPQSLTTLFYLIRKDQATKNAKTIMPNLLQIFSIAPNDQQTIEQSLNLDYRDFEHSLQMFSVRFKIKWISWSPEMRKTINLRCFRSSSLLTSSQ